MPCKQSAQRDEAGTAAALGHPGAEPALITGSVLEAAYVTPSP